MKQTAGTLAVLAVAASGLLYFRHAPVSPQPSPDYFLWAWQRPEDLGFIDAPETGVALLTGTISVDDAGNMHVAHRANPVAYPDTVSVIAMIRIEAPGDRLPRADAVAEIIVEISRSYRPIEYQLDFDARQSQREYYRLLIERLRTRLTEQPVSVTALASWCAGDPWLDTLDIDYAVPMIYRMGHDGDNIRQVLARNGRFPVTICRYAVGYSADEPLTGVDDIERLFLFHPDPWTEIGYRTLRRDVDAILR